MCLYRIFSMHCTGYTLVPIMANSGYKIINTQGHNYSFAIKGGGQIRNSRANFETKVKLWGFYNAFFFL